MSSTTDLRSFDALIKHRLDIVAAAMLGVATLILVLVDNAWGAMIARILSWSVVFLIGVSHGSQGVSPVVRKRCYFLCFTALALLLLATFARD